MRSSRIGGERIQCVCLSAVERGACEIVRGVRFLNELSPKLERSLLLVENKVASGTTFEDAETLAEYSRLVRGTNGFTDYVQNAMV